MKLEGDVFDDELGEYLLEHHGVKGQRWGVRQARKELRSTAKNARQIIKSSEHAKSASERKAAADRYEQEVVKKLRSKSFQESFKAANTITKGEIATHIILLGPLALATIPAVKKQYQSNQDHGLAAELAVSRSVLKKLRSA